MVASALYIEVDVSYFQCAKVSKMLGQQPNLVFAGANVNLTITTDSLTIVVMETGDVCSIEEIFSLFEAAFYFMGF